MGGSPGSLLGAVYALGMVLAPVPLGYAGRMLLKRHDERADGMDGIFHP